MIDVDEWLDDWVSEDGLKGIVLVRFDLVRRVGFLYFRIKYIVDIVQYVMLI